MIKINDTYYIDANSNCYTLKEKFVVSDKESKNYGEIVYRDAGYYSSIDNLLNGLLKKETRKLIADNVILTLQQLIEHVKNLEEYLKSLNLKV